MVAPGEQCSVWAPAMVSCDWFIFKILTSDWFAGEDGECTDPELVPECRDYYADSGDDIELASNRFNIKNTQVLLTFMTLNLDFRLTISRTSMSDKQ